MSHAQTHVSLESGANGLHVQDLMILARARERGSSQKMSVAPKKKCAKARWLSPLHAVFKLQILQSSVNFRHGVSGLSVITNATVALVTVIEISSRHPKTRASHAQDPLR